MLAIIVTMFVAIEHLGIMALEIFGNPAQQAKAFDLPLKFTQQHEARVSFANQGIYNGALEQLSSPVTGYLVGQP